jgi:hypothetical protein
MEEQLAFVSNWGRNDFWATQPNKLLHRFAIRICAIALDYAVNTRLDTIGILRCLSQFVSQHVIVPEDSLLELMRTVRAAPPRGRLLHKGNQRMAWIDTASSSVALQPQHLFRLPV